MRMDLSAAPLLGDSPGDDVSGTAVGSASESKGAPASEGEGAPAMLGFSLHWAHLIRLLGRPAPPWAVPQSCEPPLRGGNEMQVPRLTCS